MLVNTLGWWTSICSIFPQLKGGFFKVLWTHTGFMEFLLFGFHFEYFYSLPVCLLKKETASHHWGAVLMLSGWDVT